MNFNTIFAMNNGQKSLDNSFEINEQIVNSNFSLSDTLPILEITCNDTLTCTGILENCPEPLTNGNNEFNEFNVYQQHEQIEVPPKRSHEKLNRKQNLSKAAKLSRVFYLKNGSMKPIISPNIKSGVFRSTKQPSFTFTSAVIQNPKNIVVSNAGEQGKIVPVGLTEIDEGPIDGLNNGETIEKGLDVIEIDKNGTKNYESVESGDQHGLQTNLFSHDPINGMLRLNENERSIVYENPQYSNPIHYYIINPSELNLINDFQVNANNSFNGSPCNLYQHQSQPIYYNNFSQISRTKKSTNTLKHKEHQHMVVPPTTTIPVARTRSGRLSKPPTFMQPFVIPQIDGGSTINSLDKIPKQITKNCNKNSSELQMNSNGNVAATVTEPIKLLPRAKRKIPRQYICKTCNKIYLGSNKVKRHLKTNPTHEMLENNEKSTETNRSEQIFEYLLQKIQSVPREEGTQLFLHEISDFIGKLEMIRSRLICTSNDSIIEYIDDNVSKAFGIEKGNYQLNPNVLTEIAMDSSALFVNQPIVDDFPNVEPSGLSSSTHAHHLEYNLNLSLDSISDSKLHLAEGISEESLLQSVEELVKERIKHLPEEALTGGSSAVNFDHISDNAVEAAVGIKPDSVGVGVVEPPVLDLSLDLFQFHSN